MGRGSRGASGSGGGGQAGMAGEVRVTGDGAEWRWALRTSEALPARANLREAVQLRSGDGCGVRQCRLSLHALLHHGADILIDPIAGCTSGSSRPKCPDKDGFPWLPRPALADAVFALLCRVVTVYRHFPWTAMVMYRSPVTIWSTLGQHLANTRWEEKNTTAGLYLRRQSAEGCKVTILRDTDLASYG